MPAEPTDPADPLGLTRPDLAGRPGDRLTAVLADLGLSPRTAALGFLVCLVALLAWWWLRSPAPPPAEADVPMVTTTLPGAVASPGSTAPPGAVEVVLVHAAGAVRRPGLYELAAGERVADLIEAAGGATRAADLDRVNLAAPVADGSQVVVPRRGEPTAAANTPSGGTTTSPADGAPGPLVDLNLAGAEELETLPGIGPATSAAILEHRDANGPFASVDELIDVPGIGEAKLAALADLVTV